MREPKSPLLLGRPMTLGDLEEVARQARPVELCSDARARVRACRKPIEALVHPRDADAGDGQMVYGVNTGFGALSETRIPVGDVRDAPAEPRPEPLPAASGPTSAAPRSAR